MRVGRRSFLRMVGSGVGLAASPHRMVGAGAAPPARPVVHAAMQRWAERSTAAGVVLAVKFDDWAYWTDPGKQYFQTARDVVAPEQDRAVKPSGLASCRFTIPASGNSHSAGSFWVNFTPRAPNYKLGYSYPVQFDAEFPSNEAPRSAGKGVGHEFWVQFRWRCTPRYLRPYAATGAGRPVQRVSSTASTATVVTAGPHRLSRRDQVVIDGVTPGAYNTRGYGVAVTILDPTTFTYPIIGGPLEGGSGGVVYQTTSGAKVSILGEGDRADHRAASCTELELVITNSYYRATALGGPGIPEVYHSCGGKDGAYEGIQDTRNGRVYLQNGAGCPRAGEPPYVEPVPPCVPFYADEWLTWKYHVKIGHWYRGDIQRGYVGVSAQPINVVAPNRIVRNRGSWIADGYAPGAAVATFNDDAPANNGLFTVKAATDRVLVLREAALVSRAGSSIRVAPTVSMAGGAMTTRFPQTDRDFVVGGLPGHPGPDTQVRWTTRDGTFHTGYVVDRASPTSWTIRDASDGIMPDITDARLVSIRRYWRDSIVEVWMGRDGRPLTKIVGRSDYDLANADGLESAMYGKLIVLPYINDRRDGIVTDPAHVWLDEIIVSRQDIADPVRSVDGGAR